MIEIKRCDLLKTKGILDASEVCKKNGEAKVENVELEKILAELLTRKYEGGDNANS